MTAAALLLIVAAQVLVQLAFFLAMPGASRRGLLFGHFVGEEGARSPAATAIRGDWRRRILVAAALVMGLALLVVGAGARHEGLVLLPLLFLPLAFRAYLRGHRSAAVLVRGAPRLAAATLAVAGRGNLPISPFIAIAGALVACAWSAWSGLAAWDDLPAEIPIHFDLGGLPDDFAARSFASVFMLPLVQLVVGLGLAGTALLILRGRSVIRADTSGVSARAQDRFKRANAFLLSALSLLISAMFAVGQWSTLEVALGRAERLSPVFIALAIAMIATAVIGGLVIALRYGQGGAKLEESVADRPLPDALANERHWLWGFVYRNPEDPAMLVEHRFGLGYTLNVGNRKAVLLLALFLAFYAALVATIALLL